MDASNVYMITSESLNQDVMDIKTHLKSLDEKYQIVINALFFEGMTQQEASDELEIPLGTIKSRLKIGLRELKKIYDPE
jgi:RNA polymerase sigma-70 factor (ECF subfamily)